jgi:hypothetical protein
MILDGNLLFSNGQTVTATADSTNVLNFGALMDLGVSERPLAVTLNWTTAPVGSSPGTTTVTCSLLTSTTGTSAWTTVLTSETYIDTAVPPNWEPFKLPRGVSEYVKLNYAVASGSLTAGVLTAGLTLDAEGGEKYYPRGYTA